MLAWTLIEAYLNRLGHIYKDILVKATTVKIIWFGSFLFNNFGPPSTKMFKNRPGKKEDDLSNKGRQTFQICAEFRGLRVKG